MSDAQHGGEGWTRQDVEDDRERGIWDQDDDDLDAGVSDRAGVWVEAEPWRVTIWFALWQGLQPLGALALFHGVSGFVLDLSGEIAGPAAFARFGWQVISIYIASVVVYVWFGRWVERLRARRAELDARAAMMERPTDGLPGIRKGPRCQRGPFCVWVQLSSRVVSGWKGPTRWARISAAWRSMPVSRNCSTDRIT